MPSLDFKPPTTAGSPVEIRISHDGENTWRYAGSTLTKHGTDKYKYIIHFQFDNSAVYNTTHDHVAMDSSGTSIKHGNEVRTNFIAVYTKNGAPAKEPPSKTGNTQKPGGGGIMLSK